MTRPSPFKGLDRYEAEDAPIFFGRERESRVICSNLLGTPLTLLYGPTGVGKSSLVHAGVIPTLRKIAEEHQGPRLNVVVFNNWRAVPLLDLKRAIDAQLGVRLFNNLEADFAESIQGWSSRTSEQILLVLDQFEEFFAYQSQYDQPQSFVREFSRTAREVGIGLSTLLVIREDALSRLDLFKGYLDNVFANYLRLDPLSRAIGREVILKPIEYFNVSQPDAQYSVEGELIERVLSEVALGRVSVGDEGGFGGTIEHAPHIEAAYLQLVMKRIWEEETGNSFTRLRLGTLERLGGSERIVKRHVDDVMERLSFFQQDTAARVFTFLVTPSRAKVAYSASDLEYYTGLRSGDIGAVLEFLATGENRLLTAIPQAGAREKRFEIFHDILAPALTGWRRMHVEHVERSYRIHFLGLIATAIVAGGYALGKCFKLVLTGATAGEGLGFNTAFLLLRVGDELVGTAAVGALDQEEALYTWTKLADERPSIAEFIRQIAESREVYPIDEFVTRIRFPLDSIREVSECVNGSNPIVFRPDEVEWAQWGELFGSRSRFPTETLIAPIVGRLGQSLGVIVADNRFLVESIDREGIFGMQLLAALAAAAIELAPTKDK